MKWNLTICGLSLRWCVQGPFMLYHSLVLHSFVLPNNIPLFTHFVYPFSRWRVFGLFSFFGYYAISFCVHSYTGFCMDIVFQFLGCVLRSVIAESFCNLLSQICNLLLNILRNYCIVFQTWCTILQSHQQCRGFPVFPHLCQYCYCLFYFSHPRRYEWMNYCGFDLYFTYD